MNEYDLVNNIKNHDAAAEKEFVKLYYGKIMVILRVRINNHEDRKELINDILVAAVLKIRAGNFDIERDSNLAVYVYGIARNSINLYFKRLYKKRERDEKLKNEFFEPNVNANIAKFEFETTEEIKQNKKIWRSLIEQLKPKYRDIIYWRYYDNFSVSEISSKLNIPPQKVSDYLKYAKQLLLQSFTNK